LQVADWDAAIFAQAGLERIGLRPANSMTIDWMLSAPAQGAIVVMCRKDDIETLNACSKLNDTSTALCTRIERDFLRTLLGGCSTPISALAVEKDNKIHFKGNIYHLTEAKRSRSKNNCVSKRDRSG
jgi:hydroxymethylbilane synthase